MIQQCLVIAQLWLLTNAANPTWTADASVAAQDSKKVAKADVDNIVSGVKTIVLDNGNRYAVLRVVQNVLSSEACNILCKDDNRCIAADYGSNAIGGQCKQLKPFK